MVLPVSPYSLPDVLDRVSVCFEAFCSLHEVVASHPGCARGFLDIALVEVLQLGNSGDILRPKTTDEECGTSTGDHSKKQILIAHGRSR